MRQSPSDQQQLLADHLLATAASTSTTAPASAADHPPHAFSNLTDRQSIVADQIIAMRRQESSPHYKSCDSIRRRRRRRTSTDFGTPPVDLQTHVDILKVDEKELALSPASSSSSKQKLPPALDPTCRAKVTTWLYQITDYLSISRENVELALSYLDRYLASDASNLNPNHDGGSVHDGICHQNQNHQHQDQNQTDKVERCAAEKLQYQLCAMTCLYISIKLNEAKEMPIALLCQLSHGKYSAQDVVDMEQSIVVRLRWRLSDPTATAFCRQYLELLPWSDEEQVETIRSLTEILAQLCAGDLSLVRVDKSTIALACLRNAIRFAGGACNSRLGDGLGCIACLICGVDDVSSIDSFWKDVDHAALCLDRLSSDSETMQIIVCGIEDDEETSTTDTSTTTASTYISERLDGPAPNMNVSASPVCISVSAAR